MPKLYFQKVDTGNRYERPMRVSCRDLMQFLPTASINVVEWNSFNSIENSHRSVVGYPKGHNISENQLSRAINRVNPTI